MPEHGRRHRPLEPRNRSLGPALFLRFSACGCTLTQRMSPRIPTLFALLLAGTLQAKPSYSAASIVNAADSLAGPLAPNTIATIYGTGLAYGTKWLTADDIRAGLLPTVL